jgi:hypothetical protein
MVEKQKERKRQGSMISPEAWEEEILFDLQPKKISDLNYNV